MSLCSDDDDDAGSLDILMEAPEGFRNSDEECFSESQVTTIARIPPEAWDLTFCNSCCSSAALQQESSVEDGQDLGEMEMAHDLEEHGEEKGAEQPGERRLDRCAVVCATTIHTRTFVSDCSGGSASQDQGERPSTPSHLATTVF